MTGDGRPEMFPVNYVVRNGTVVFVTGSAVLQAWAPLGHVAFEVDCVDLSSHEGWDVVVSGEGAEITDAVDRLSVEARADRFEEWAPGPKRALDNDRQPTLSRTAALCAGASAHVLLVIIATPSSSHSSCQRSSARLALVALPRTEVARRCRAVESSEPRCDLQASFCRLGIGSRR